MPLTFCVDELSVTMEQNVLPFIEYRCHCSPPTPQDSDPQKIRGSEQSSLAMLNQNSLSVFWPQKG